jgi:hypothetical protein
VDTTVDEVAVLGGRIDPHFPAGGQR